MSRKIYYKSEFMDEMNKSLVTEITNIVMGDTLSPERKLATIEGMLTIAASMRMNLADENEEN